MCTRKGYAASVSQLTLATAALYFPLLEGQHVGKRSAVQPPTIDLEFPQPKEKRRTGGEPVRRLTAWSH